MQNFVKYFGLSALVTVGCLTGGFILGGSAGLLAVFILAILEVSLSLDNAVVNATEIQKMDAFWRKMFLTVGMLIAVFGMRLYFPLLIVSMTTGMGLMQVGHLALEQPKVYAEHLIGAHAMIAGFGGAFLLMVFLEFFMDDEKDHHWLGWLEKPLAAAGKIDCVQIALSIIILWFAKSYLSAEEGMHFFLAGIAGVLTHIIVGSLEVVITGITGLVGGGKAAGTAVKSGLAGFLYLEVLDASFSFDGVIGAFAITTDVVIIMMGLAIGAMFVRSLTIVAVEKDTLSEFQYLEHGAFWAIGSLAVVMFVGTFVEIPEVISGLLGGGILGASFLHSLFTKGDDEEEGGLVGTTSSGPN